MTNEEIARAFLEEGWEIRYRGGNSMCATPSDMDLVVADAPGALGGEAGTPWLGPPPRYSIAAPASGAGPRGGHGPVFDLHDAERGVAVGVRRVPTPGRAAELLGRYGVPEYELRGAPGPVMVPEAAEQPARGPSGPRAAQG